MTGSGDEGEDPEMSPADRAWAAMVAEISRDFPGVEIARDQWGKLTATDGDQTYGPVSCPAALRALIGCPKPRDAAS